MALEEFENEELSDREKNLVRMKSITNYVMGVFFIGVGFVVDGFFYCIAFA